MRTNERLMKLERRIADLEWLLRTGGTPQVASPIETLTQAFKEAGSPSKEPQTSFTHKTLKADIPGDWARNRRGETCGSPTAHIVIEIPQIASGVAEFKVKLAEILKEVAEACDAPVDSDRGNK